MPPAHPTGSWCEHHHVYVVAHNLVTLEGQWQGQHGVIKLWDITNRSRRRHLPFTGSATPGTTATGGRTPGRGLEMTGATGEQDGDHGTGQRTDWRTDWASGDALTPTREDRFTFGLWTVGRQGVDVFGGAVRPPLEPAAAIERLAELGASGVTFH